MQRFLEVYPPMLRSERGTATESHSRQWSCSFAHESLSAAVQVWEQLPPVSRGAMILSTTPAFMWTLCLEARASVKKLPSIRVQTPSLLLCKTKVQTSILSKEVENRPVGVFAQRMCSAVTIPGKEKRNTFCTASSSSSSSSCQSLPLMNI